MLWSIDASRRASLQEQIAGNIRRAVADGELAPGERLPPAAELAEALEVNRNTVLAALRQLRDEGLLEFRRGRGVRVTAQPAGQGQVVLAVQHLLELGQLNGYTPAELSRLLEDLS